MKNRISTIAFMFFLMSHMAFPQNKQLVAKGSSGRKMAFVIGNSAYKGGVLKNPLNDAMDMRKMLRAKGFSVSECCDNVGFHELTIAIDDWTASLKKDDVAIFYYSGHGIRVNGSDFLVPTDYPPSSTQADVKFRAYSVDELQEKMQERATRINVIILDACRDNPYVLGKGLEKGIGGSLAGFGTCIIYAASPGQVASANPDGRNSLFTLVLMEEMKQPSISLRTLAVEVKDKVYSLSNGLQIPYISENVVGDIMLSVTNVVEVQTQKANLTTETHRTPSFPIVSPEMLLWAVGDKGSILHTVDGGKNWKAQNSNTNSDLCSVTFVTPQLGWVVGEGGTILQSKDGGDTWVPQNSNTKVTLMSVSFVTAKIGWVVGSGTILHTDNGGDTWEPQKIQPREGESQYTFDQSLNSVFFASQRVGWAVGREILHTEGGGGTWTPQPQRRRAIETMLYSVVFTTPKSGWAVGGWNTILHTEDGGVSWMSQETGFKKPHYYEESHQLNNITFVTNQMGWAVDDKGNILHTEDAGRRWKAKMIGKDICFFSAAFSGHKVGWVAGTRGVILHTEDGGESWNPQNSGVHVHILSIVGLFSFTNSTQGFD